MCDCMEMCTRTWHEGFVGIIGSLERGAEAEMIRAMLEAPNSIRGRLHAPAQYCKLSILRDNHVRCGSEAASEANVLFARL